MMITMEKARRDFEDIAKRACELGISPTTLAGLPSVQRLSTCCYDHPRPTPRSSCKLRLRQLLLCSVATFIILLFGILIPLTFMVLHQAHLLPDTPQIHRWHKHLARFWLEEWLQLDMDDELCIIENVEQTQDLFRPPVNCSVCMNVTQVDRVSKMDPENFVRRYAYSGRPVVVTDATANWTAMQRFSFNFFKSIYGKESPVLLNEDDNCQFFPYKTDFENLGEVLQMSASRAGLLDGSDPWYIGWSNCDSLAANILRLHYKRPYFLPANSESSKTDWIFMGSPGYGAPLHIDDVDLSSWQAQIRGTKKWTLEPPPECYLQCQTLDVTVYPGEIIVIDTNKWFHETLILGDELSIVIGSEYD